jgi:hypothetical protein
VDRDPARNHSGNGAEMTAMAILPERPPTSREIATWESIRNRIINLDRAILANRLKAENLDLAENFSLKYGIIVSNVPSIASEGLNVLETNVRKLKNIVSSVESFKLGIRLRSDGDLDILASPGTKKEALTKYDLESIDGIPIIPILIGVVVIAGLGALVAYMKKKNDEITTSYNRALIEADDRLCADPDSAMCIDWEQTKKKEGFEKRLSLVESLTETAKPIAKGLGVGLAIGIALFIWSFARGEK